MHALEMGVGREERSTAEWNATGYISASGKSASSSLKSGGAIAPTAPTVPTPMMRGNGETDFCLEFVAQWFVCWYSSLLRC